MVGFIVSIPLWLLYFWVTDKLFAKYSGLKPFDLLHAAFRWIGDRIYGVYWFLWRRQQFEREAEAFQRRVSAQDKESLAMGEKGTEERQRDQ